MTTGPEKELFFEYGAWEMVKFIDELHRYTLEHRALPEGASEWAMPVLAQLKECLNIDSMKGN